MEPVIRPGARLEAGPPPTVSPTSATRPPTAVAKITICRPEVRNAFRPPARCSSCATPSRSPATIPRSGSSSSRVKAPTRCFCSGGDQRVRGDDGLPRRQAASAGWNVLDLQVQIRRLPKPVVAMVAGYAIGWRSRAAHRVRPPHDRRRQRALRSDPVRASVRSTAVSARVCSRASSGRRRHARSGTLCEQLRRRCRARHGTRQQGRAARRPRSGDRRVGAQDVARTQRSRCCAC